MVYLQLGAELPASASGGLTARISTARHCSCSLGPLHSSALTRKAPFGWIRQWTTGGPQPPLP